MDEAKGTAFVVLGVVSVIAVVGVVLLLTDSGATGMAESSIGGCNSPSTPVTALPGENAEFLKQWVAAGYTCEKAPGKDVYGKETWCCTAPQGVPVNERYQGVPIL